MRVEVVAEVEIYELPLERKGKEKSKGKIINTRSSRLVQDVRDSSYSL